jgi:thiol:disulfide interchange protein
VTVLLYILERLPWAGAGLLAGYLLGLHIRKGTGVNGNGKKWRPNGRDVFGLILVILGIFTAVQTMVQSRATDRLTVCVATYSDQLAVAIDIRSKASAEAQRASDVMWQSIANLPQTDEGRAKARQVFTEYIAKREAANRAQEQNPYPPPPRAVC